jgi:GT2 family glycosyltransferase
VTAGYHGEKVPPHVVIGFSGQLVEAERETLERNTAPGFELVTLADEGALGFNELIGHHADVWVLLEAGARVAPRWLALLLGALERPGCGLAGPSTNWAWNEQACGSNAAGDLAGLSRQASRLAARFGSGARSLEPLYSLGAFCYAVRREVVSTLGPADAAYENGPCWEMDYNVRAARAGFTGLWVGAAYVHRKRLGARATLAQEAIFERNRRLYQDRLCGLRLSGQRGGGDYETHCRGEACEYFAPSELLSAPAASRPPSEPPAVVSAVERQPLVTCVMVTRDRTEFALRAVEHFRRQSYPARELIVVEDGTPSLGTRLPADSSIRLVTTGLVQTIGALRNRGCELARGEVVVLWDDDDWHGPDRLAHQVGPILSGRADVTGLTDLCWLELDPWRCWQLDRPTQERMLLHRTYGGTLAFRRRYGSA